MINSLLNSIISYWKLDESSGNAIDSAGNNHGSVVGPTQNQSGKINTAYSFDGSNDYIDTNTLWKAMKSFSVSMWVYANAYSGTNTLIGNGDNDDDDSGFGIYVFGGVISFALNTSTNFVGGSFTTTGSWIHVVAVAEGYGIGDIKLYINGSLLDSDTQAYNPTDSTDNLIIGANADHASRFWNGKIDEVGIWDRALTSDEVTALYNSGNGLAFPFTGNISLKKVSGILNQNIKKINKLDNDDIYTKLLIHANGTDGATAYTAETSQIVTFGGNAQLDTAQSKFGLSSILFDGVADYITIPSSLNWKFGVSAFTVDFWFRLNSVGRLNILYSHGGSNASTYTGGVFTVGSDNLIHWYCSGYVINCSTTVTVSEWHHIAIVGNGGADGSRIIKIYLDGILDGSATVNYNFIQTEIMFGANQDDTNEDLDGWIDEIRISKTQRWTSNFTPPIRQYREIKKVAGVSNI